jgi:hypothetical protein
VRRSPLAFTPKVVAVAAAVALVEINLEKAVGPSIDAKLRG